ncbi:MAG: chorismate mutase [Chloroflexi bacterium]|nr:chorismate mutase [Chloroflexota bacterium]
MRGVRGATTAPTNTRQAMLDATRELLVRLVEENDIRTEDIVSIFFTATTDLNAVHPALAARQLMGWTYLPLLCAQEIAVPNSLPRTIRVLIHWNTPKTHDEIRHVYINGAEVLRPDFAGKEEPT